MQYCFAVVHDVVIVHIDVVVIVVVDPWNLPLKFGQNWVINSWDLVDVLVVSWDIADIEFVVVVVCKLIFFSNPTFVKLGWVELWLSLGWDNINLQACSGIIHTKSIL